MKARFIKHLTHNFPQLLTNQFLIAISGGIDSVVLAHLCHEAQLDFALAHCNFQLRGEESDGDEAFVRALGQKWNTEVFVKKFDTKKGLSEGASIQLAARELRYNWFAELSQKQAIPYVLTAHHLNDEVETFFINLIRGTGLKGLSGIPAKNENIIRPLLCFSSEEILNYAKAHHIDWREDRSNATDHYVRNRIRHHIVPFLEQEDQHFLANFHQTQQHLKQAERLITDYIKLILNELSFEKSGQRYFDVEKLSDLPHTEEVLYHLFSPYSFTSFKDIKQLLSAQTGKYVESDTHQLLRDRAYLILREKQALVNQEYLIHSEDKKIDFPGGQIICENVINVTKHEKTLAYLAKRKLEFPLKLRIWQAGDRFQPSGMEGTRKISDFLKDLKLSKFEKENTWVLLSEDQIVWVVGYRISEIFKANDNSTEIFKISLL